MPTDAAYQIFSLALGFLIVLIISQATQQLAEGAKMMHTVGGELLYVTDTLLVSATISTAGQDAVLEFKHALVQIMSLFFAVGIEDCVEHNGTVESLCPRLIDAKGLDKRTLHLVNNADCKPEVACQAVQSLIFRGVSSGVLCHADIVLPLALEHVGNAAIALSEARTYKATPFLISLKVLMRILLLLNWLITPFFAAWWSQGIGGAAMYTLIPVFFFQCLFEIALDLENPFDGGEDDVRTASVQERFDRGLLSALRAAVVDESGGVLEEAAVGERGAAV